MTEDDKGRLIATDQYGGLYRITVPPLAGGETKVEALDVPVAGGHGVLWFEGKLYIVVNEKAEKNSSETGGWVVDAKGEGWGEPKLLKGIKAQVVRGRFTAEDLAHSIIEPKPSNFRPIRVHRDRHPRWQDHCWACPQ